MAAIQKIKDEQDITRALSSLKGIVFKHSTRCSISSHAKKVVDNFAQTCDDTITLYMVDVITDRELSSEIEKRTGIQHQSPQVIFIKDEAVAGAISHLSITIESLTQGIS